MSLLHCEESYFFSSDERNGAQNKSQDGSTFSVQLNNPISIPKEAMYCTLEVTSATIWNNTPNISAAIGNNKLYFHTEVDTSIGTDFVITIPDGLYGVSELTARIQREMLGLGLPRDVLLLTADDATQRIVVSFGYANTWLDFGDGSPTTLSSTDLGFNNAVQVSMSVDLLTLSGTDMPLGRFEVGDTFRFDSGGSAFAGQTFTIQTVIAGGSDTVQVFDIDPAVASQALPATTLSFSRIRAGAPRTDTFREVLGFDTRLVPLTPKASSHSEGGDFTAAFNRVNNFIIKSDIISDGISVNAINDSIIADVLITSEPGDQIVFTPFHPPKANADELIGHRKNFLSFRLTDQVGRPVETMSENWSFTVVLKYVLKV